MTDLARWPRNRGFTPSARPSRAGSPSAPRPPRRRKSRRLIPEQNRGRRADIAVSSMDEPRCVRPVPPDARAHEESGAPPRVNCSVLVVVAALPPARALFFFLLLVVLIAARALARAIIIVVQIV